MDSSPLFKEIETQNSLGRLCFHRYLSAHGGGLCPVGVSVLGGNRGPGRVSVRGGLCPVGGSLSSGGLSVGETPSYGYVRAVRILLECIPVLE